jgi:hypothetical protein
VNLCRPDSQKSCAACCGLYNVPNATRPHLLEKLHTRTTLFAAVPRSAEAIVEFEAVVRALDHEKPLDSAIHVCEFTGFVDEQSRIVGCLLHPSGPGNDGVDLRGLCHYGSMACKTFFCPAWEEVPARYLEIAIRVVDDWHLYGLVVTDVAFLCGVFGLLEDALGRELDPAALCTGPAADMLHDILAWKDTWLLKGTALRRRSRYYVKSHYVRGLCRPSARREDVLAALSFTFGVDTGREAGDEWVRRQIEAVATMW